MLLNLIKQRFNILSFIFASSVICGTVFMAVSLTFVYMLSEAGVPTSKIALLTLISNSPYTMRFLIAPFIKNIIKKFNTSRFDIIKLSAYIAQTLVMILLCVLGFFDSSPALVLAGVTIFVLTTAISVHDILMDHVRLNCFHGENIGLAASINNMGFRFGMLISGAGAIYLAEIFSWKLAFFALSLTTLISTIATIFLPKINCVQEDNKASNIHSIKTYVKFCLDVFKKNGFWILIILFFSYKFSDSCISYFKTIFLQSKGLSKIDFVNISQILGVFSVITGGIIAGAVSYRLGPKKCMQITFYLQMVCSLCFVVIAKYSPNLTSSAMLINTSTLLFGYSTVAFRTYLSEQANSDINTYTILTSFSSIFRLFSVYIGGILTDFLSWEGIYLVCLLSNIPGIFAYRKILKREKK